ncbi:hypothetical protein [Lentzea sp. NEAU-D7]|uniref:hypothetical protein n=1 Tax=Lentzea sp. NEAU-D7 TaxID=2994667 RepID=UPI00224B1623|nr:hypothetical protein [Lentzea sp. NEAU-D7]MCX2950607.1 hypothetical protein [Lentzea sp. NEAU-D7]
MREVGGWIYEDNLTRVVEYIATLVHYRWDDLDSGALEAGIPSTDADLPPSTWFEYPIVGTPEITLRIARDHEGGILSVTISGGVDAVLAARFETLLDLH